jgi:FkbM family methyltransferase
MINIPLGDIPRLHLVGKDPEPGIVKEILVMHENFFLIVDHTQCLSINVNELKSTSVMSSTMAEEKLAKIHSTINFSPHDIKIELPEQLMSVRYIKPTDTVLELGANYGRNTCVISRLLNNDARIFTLETDGINASVLNNIKKANNFKFNIVNAGLSQKKLIQRGWDSRPIEQGEVVPLNWTEVPTITWSYLQQQAAPLKFNVLVADCEGALYHILKEEPDFFNGFERVIMENDYNNYEHKLYVNQKLEEQGLRCIYREPGGWGPCYYCFFETWARC